jgi:hypothetical protein
MLDRLEANVSTTLGRRAYSLRAYLWRPIPCGGRDTGSKQKTLIE